MGNFQAAFSVDQLNYLTTINGIIISGTWELATSTLKKGVVYRLCYDELATLDF